MPDHKAVSASGAAALVPPQYGAAARVKHAHAKVGGGSHTHTHTDAVEGHRHRAGSEDGHPDVALLPMVKSSSLEGKGPAEARAFFAHLFGKYGDDPTSEQIDAAYHDVVRAMAEIEAEDFVTSDAKAERTVDQATRDEWAKQGWALPDGSFPIPDAEHGGRDFLRRAIASYGRGGSGTSRVKAHIIKRARALGLTSMLPDDWIPAKGWTLDFDVKSVATQDDGTLLLKGYGNTWDVDRDGERTIKGAFDDTLATYMTNPILLYNHREGQEIGTVTVARPDSKGLYVEAEVPSPPPGAPGWHVKVYSDIKRRILRTFSMGGVFHRGKSADTRNCIYKVDLYELSVVSIPSNHASLFELAHAKGLTFEPETKAKPSMPGVGRGHGAHHHGPTGARKRGVTHRHRSGTVKHTHRSRNLGVATSTEVVKSAQLDDADATDVETNIDDLLEGLQDAIEEVIDRDDLDDDAKVASIKTILSEFVDEMQDGDNGDDDEDATDKALSFVESRSVATGRKLRNTLVQLEQKGATRRMGEEGTTGQGDGAGTESGTAGTKGAVIEIPRERWEEMQRTVSALAQEKRERDMEAKAAELAAQQVAEEAKRAEEAKKAAEAEQQKMASMVAAAVETLRAGVTSGRKFIHPTSTEGNGTGGGDAGGYIGSTGAGGSRNGHGRKGFQSWLRDLRDAKRGDWLARQRLDEIQQKAAEWYATDADGVVDQKALAEATTGAGGFLVPPQYWQAGIAEFRLAAAKIRRMVTVITAINSNLVYIPRETGVSTVGWTSENAGKPSTDQTFGQIAVNIFTLAGISKVSKQLLEDSSPAVDQIVRTDLGRVLGQAEDIAFINGTGAGQPTGILQTAGTLNVAYAAPSAGSGLADAISAAFTAIDSNFFDVPNGILAHPRMIAKLRQVKDSQGRYIFEPGFATGLGPWVGGMQSFTASGTGNIPGFATAQPNNNSGGPVGSVWGMNVWSDANIPTTLTWNGTNFVGGGAESPIIVGVWEEAYLLERSGVTIDVSDEAGTSWEQNQVWYRGEERCGFTAARQPLAFCTISGLTNAIAG